MQYDWSGRQIHHKKTTNASATVTPPVPVQQGQPAVQSVCFSQELLFQK